jgi:hypothetical protein
MHARMARPQMVVFPTPMELPPHPWFSRSSSCCAPGVATFSPTSVLARTVPWMRKFRHVGKKRASWMKYSREAISDVIPGTWPEKCDVPLTLRNKTAYLHLLPSLPELIHRVTTSSKTQPGKPNRFQQSLHHETPHLPIHLDRPDLLPRRPRRGFTGPYQPQSGLALPPR